MNISNFKISNPLNYYYHISLNPDIKKLVPHIPKTNSFFKEDNSIARICLAPTISLAIQALFLITVNIDDLIKYSYFNDIDPNKILQSSTYYENDDDYNNNFDIYVYKIYPDSDIYKPTTNEVFDADITKEHWLLKEQDVIKIGTVRKAEVITTGLDYKKQFKCRGNNFQSIGWKYNWLDFKV
jgi:hypothetical protein